MKRKSAILLSLLLSISVFGQTRDLARWVNPFIGTGGHGHTFPGATVPFGLVQLSPDTRIDNWDGSSGYHFSDDTIYGFSHTHLSGTGIPDGCDILFMPVIGKVEQFSRSAPEGIRWYASKFSHQSEKAEAGYYSVKLENDNILAELTSTARVGLHRYTFTRTEIASIAIDLHWRDKTIDSSITKVGNNRIEGFRRSSSWAKDQAVYFVAEFSKPFDRPLAASKITHADNIGLDGEDSSQKFQQLFPFKVVAGEQILLKVAISPVSIEGARKNLAAEMPGWNFDKVRADARDAWNKELNKINVTGGTEAQMTTFYSALYHTMIQPNIFQDVDGNYRGHDGKVHNVNTEFQVAQAEFRQSSQKPGYARPDRKLVKSDQYSVFSLWDTFRAAHPLYTIIDQRRTVDFINTFIRQYEQGGRLPVWELWGNETDCMIGYHAVPVIADAMAKGIKGFDYEKAYRAAKHSAELNRDGLAAYKKRGYISMEDENESVSKTLEYAYDDWCIAEMAKIMARRYEDFLLTVDKRLYPDLGSDYGKDYETYSARARAFENLFDPETGFMRPKKNGGFISPFAPNEVTFNFTEGNSWVYSFFVPQDVSRLMELQGGRQRFAAKLDDLFTTTDKLAGREQPDITGLIGQYAHGNEPSHHIAYLYDYAAEPWKTQNLVRKIMDEFYKPEPDGLIGNEDCGQMSAWYILSAAGLYEVTPGSSIYAFGTPLFPEYKFNLENGRSFTIKAPGTSATKKYIASVRLNGKDYRKAFLEHSDLMNGGVLEFTMTDKETKSAFTEFPRSSIEGRSAAVPLINGGGRNFNGQTTVTLTTTTPGSKIMFGTDRIDPPWMPYTVPITIGETTRIFAKTVAPDGFESKIAEAQFVKKSNNWAVKIASRYSRQYTGGGDDGLIDGIRGTVNFASGEWQGYQGQDFVATVDLQKPTTISKVGGGFLQVARSWIWMPTHVKFEVSENGADWKEVADIKTDVDLQDMDSKFRDYTQSISPVNARYVRVHAYNLGKIPSWHPGAGGNAYIFVDEIIINQ